MRPLRACPRHPAVPPPNLFPCSAGKPGHWLSTPSKPVTFRFQKGCFQTVLSFAHLSPSATCECITKLRNREKAAKKYGTGGSITTLIFWSLDCSLHPRLIGQHSGSGQLLSRFQSAGAKSHGFASTHLSTSGNRNANGYRFGCLHLCHECYVHRPSVASSGHCQAERGHPHV